MRLRDFRVIYTWRVAVMWPPSVMPWRTGSLLEVGIACEPAGMVTWRPLAECTFLLRGYAYQFEVFTASKRSPQNAATFRNSGLSRTPTTKDHPSVSDALFSPPPLPIHLKLTLMI